ncbi:MAG: alpha/beta hydrolase [Kaiparowitsia implicata GSE-PSE-MK54-09C]|nr:alpha/beta hydrolase [Kaiparowitsia implicata GSE-PSE-MK54-09C]
MAFHRLGGLPQRMRRTWMMAAGLGCLISLTGARPGWSAEEVRFSAGLLQFTLPVESLETFAETGVADSRIRFLGRFIDDLDQFRSFLQISVPFNPVYVNQFSYTHLGETFLTDLGEGIQTGSGQNGMRAMRAALTLAAQDPEGVSLIGILQQFPTQEVQIDLGQLNQWQRTFARNLAERDRAIATIRQQSQLDQSAQPTTDFAQQPDLRQPGAVFFERQTLSLSRVGVVPGPLGEPLRQFLVDLYLPTTSLPAPLVVLSHGLGSKRQDLDFLAEHLASHGFAVAVPDHVGSDERYQRGLGAAQHYARSNPAEFIERPRDISQILDELESRVATDAAWRDRLDLTRVGVAGQSYGGYTTLATAGATLDIAQLQATCAGDRPFAGFAALLQCDAADLPEPHYRLGDPRIRAAVALNPVASSIFGADGLSAITIPTLMLTATDDVLAPMMPEQVQPFANLTTPERYLAVMENGNHATVYPQLAVPGATTSPILLLTKGPDPALGGDYARALTLAMMQVYVAEDEAARSYLSAAYADYLSREPMPLSLVRSLSPTPQSTSQSTSQATPE